MNQRDLSEIKRRLNPERRNPTVLRGCYISSEGQVISRFAQRVGSLPQEENEKYMSIFKRVLSGTAGQNLLSVELGSGEAELSEEQRLLLALCDSGLTDEEMMEQFEQRVVAYIQKLHEEQALSIEEAQNASNYLLLLLHDGYDVPGRDCNGEIDREQSESILNYMLCALCPVKLSKPALRYFAAESEFHSRDSDWTVGAPELGFMYPAYEERCANIHHALYYTKDTANLHNAFAQNVFHTELQMTAAEQKEVFQSVLQESLAEECNLNVVQSVHEAVETMLEERKADKTAEPLCLSKQEVQEVLQNCGVSEEKTAAFAEQFTQSFGEYAEIPAVNLVSPKQFKVETSGVSIRVDPEHRDRIETRVIDGRYYILILADGDVEVNGLKIDAGYSD
ncbi:MAG: DUF4317 domain-containing protein [Eubacteriales bacterium]|nr:DUF4317 domain-containing protein [Eubacteriales bacterium]